MPRQSKSANPSVARRVVRLAKPTPAQAELLQKRCELGQALDSFDARLPTPRRTHDRLGVQLNRVSDDKLEITSAADENDVVRPGLVAQWNKLQDKLDKHQQSKLRIKPGDRITAVNHSPDYMGMLEQLDQAPRVTLSIERDRVGVLTPIANLSAASQSRPPKLTDGLSSRRPSELTMLPPLPSVKCDNCRSGCSMPSISEGSTREPTPRKLSPKEHPGPHYAEALRGIEAAYLNKDSPSSATSPSPSDRSC